MKVTYSIDPAERVVDLQYTGSPSVDEWTESVMAACRDPRFQPGFSFLLDRRLAEAPSTDYIRRVVDFVAAHPSEFAGSSWAVVVSGPASYGMARMAQALGEQVALNQHVFTDIDEARRWLRGEAPTA